MINRDKCLYYTTGYKYQVTRDFHILLAIKGYSLARSFFTLDTDGNLTIKEGYAWNGASGPTWDTTDSIIGSLVHDVGYQMIRRGFIDAKYKAYFDGMLHDLCTEDGMWAWRADYWRWAVLNFGMKSCRPSAEPLELVAP